MTGASDNDDESNAIFEPDSTTAAVNEGPMPDVHCDNLQMIESFGRNEQKKLTDAIDNNDESNAKLESISSTATANEDHEEYDLNESNAFGWFDPHSDHFTVASSPRAHQVEPDAPPTSESPPSPLLNDFQPFQRLPNMPFSNRRGRRAFCLTSLNNSFIPELQTIIGDVETLFR